MGLQHGRDIEMALSNPNVTQDSSDGLEFAPENSARDLKNGTNGDADGDGDIVLDDVTAKGIDPEEDTCAKDGGADDGGQSSTETTQEEEQPPSQTIITTG
jgi:hypothetical protein